MGFNRSLCASPYVVRVLDFHGSFPPRQISASVRAKSGADTTQPTLHTTHTHRREKGEKGEKGKRRNDVRACAMRTEGEVVALEKYSPQSRNGHSISKCE